MLATHQIKPAQTAARIVAVRRLRQAKKFSRLLSQNDLLSPQRRSSDRSLQLDQQRSSSLVCSCLPEPFFRRSKESGSRSFRFRLMPSLAYLSRCLAPMQASTSVPFWQARWGCCFLGLASHASGGKMTNPPVEARLRRWDAVPAGPARRPSLPRYN